MKKLGLAIAAAAMVAFAGSAWADHGAGGLPAGKVLVVADDTLVTDPAGGGASVHTLFGPISYKMSKSGDIIVSVHQECKIVTEGRVKGNAIGAVTQDSERGFARVWIEIQSHDTPTNLLVLNTAEFDNVVDQICSVSTATTCIAVNLGAVTMCDRKLDLKLTSSGDEDLTVNIATLQTHGFTWFGKDVAKTDGADSIPIGGEVDIFVKAQVFGEDGGIIEVRKRVVEIDSAHFAN